MSQKMSVKIFNQNFVDSLQRKNCFVFQEYFELLVTASQQPHTLSNCPGVTFEE